jgi:DNA-binding NarL/FixJ family response regulator/anti-sigma regulatory factor (Ser/Thr protein kinase)
MRTPETQTIGPIRVIIVDDSASTRTMLREALSLDEGIEVVGEAGSGPEAIERAGELSPDVVLMDVRMPDGSGVDAARLITAQLPTSKIVALTWSDDPRTVREMLTAGAIGYVVKGGTIDELCEAIRHATTGEAELDQRVLPTAIEDLRRLLEEERGRREQVERLAKARAEFVQVLSHELRTPLTVILGALRMLEQGSVKPEEAPLIESAVRRAGELEFLVEGLELVGSEPSSEGVAYPRQAIEKAAERIDAGPDAITIAEEQWPGVPHRYVHRVAFELLSNAVRHGQRPIEVFAAREAGMGVLTVADAGGWTPPMANFDAFFQADMTATRPRGGFGLGLFVASRLCQSCEGDLAVTAVDGKTRAEARFRLK